MSISTPALHALIEKARKATPGEYRAWIEGTSSDGIAVVTQVGRGDICFGCKPGGSPDIDDANYYAAASPDTIIPIVEELIQARQTEEAHRAEILERRKKSPWKGPFGVGITCVIDKRFFRAAEDVSFEQGQNPEIAAALNLYYGFNPATGEDECK